MRPLIAAAILIAAASTTALAQGVSGNAPGTNMDAVIGFYGEGGLEETGSPSSDTGIVDNLGGAISGGFYGNTSNAGVDGDAPANGHGVTPSQSPGPTVTEGGDVVPGASLGHAITGNGPSAVPNN